MCIGGEYRVFRGTVAVVSADNLGSNALGGFKEGSTAHRPCRQCMGTLEEMKVEVFFALCSGKCLSSRCTIGGPPLALYWDDF